MCAAPIVNSSVHTNVLGLTFTHYQLTDPPWATFSPQIYIHKCPTQLYHFLNLLCCIFTIPFLCLLVDTFKYTNTYYLYI